MASNFKVFIVFSIVFSSFFLRGQDSTLVLNKTEFEALFLKNNLALLIENLSITKAEAEIIQARVWPNPTFSIEDVNLWRPNSIKNEELTPPLVGDFGRNHQFTIGFEQLIITAGKRKKLIELKEMGYAYSQQYFEEVLRNLKVEFRHSLNQLNFLQKYKEVYKSQLTSINQLKASFKNQVEQGYLNKGEYIRLKALSMEVLHELNQLESEYESVEHHIKLLINVPVYTTIQLKEEGMKVDQEKLISLDTQELIDSALVHRPDFQLAKLEEEMAMQSRSIARAERIPDLSFLGNYNRGDALYPNYVGFGIAFDLPIFNRNKGNIRLAEIEIEQAKNNQKLAVQSIKKEIALAISQYKKAIEFAQQIDDNYDTELDQILAAYTQNFTNQNISIIEYLDFLDAYLENKRIILQAEYQLREKAEELNSAIGIDLIK